MPITALPHLSTDDTLAPLDEMTTPDKIVSAMMDNSLPEIIREIGYAFTSSVEDCKNYLVNFSTRELTAVEVARIISTMMKYKIAPQEGPQIQTPGNFWMNHEKKDSIEHVQAETWKAEIFVQALKILIPNLNWKEVILQLDHPDFFVPDRQSLSLLFTILRLGLQSSGYPLTLFPVEYLYRRWTNLEGQMSLINGILKHPEIFCFSDYPFHPVAIDILKAQPEIDNKEISTWHNLYLIELLLYAAERGYYGQVHELFKFPLQHCPDILFLALLQTSSPMNVFRQELLTNLIPVFLGNHPNSGTILHHAWHILNPNIKPIIMHAMADWYMRGECDQSRLSRILDVAQDLKALSLLLNVQSFPFVIDLACLASRREYLKLDKWLTDKIRDHGEAFVQAMVKFLQRRCLQAYEKGGDVQPPKATQLPHETIATILTCLQLCVPNVQPELQEAIFSVVAGCQRFILGKPRQMASIGQPQAKALEAPFTPASGLGGQLFPPHVDSITSLTSNVAGMSLGAATNTFAMPSAYSPFVPTNSPSRLMGAVPNNTFTILPFQHNTNVPNIAGLPRLPPTPMREKPRIPDLLSFPDATTSVSKEIEDEANSYFQCIYNHPPHPTLSIEEVLDMLKNFHDSPIKRERDVYSCMLRNLFEEYKFFPQYPDKELNITAQLFGGIIEKGLVPSYVSLGLALRFVLDALRNPEGSKMYCFGITALDKFKSRLKDYHKYCEHVRAIPHFPTFPPHLIEYIEYGLRSQEPPTKPQGSVLSSGMPTGLNPNAPVASTSRAVVCAPSTSSAVPNTVNTMGAKSSRPSIANVTNIDTLLAAKNEKIIIPPESIQDKTSFIFNNLSQLNLQKKSEELKEIIAEEYYPWLSQYLVLRRVSIEPNFQIIYSNFLDCLNIPILNKIVLKETYRNIKVLLRTEKELADFSDRKLLRDLGYWLGMITLKKDIPILHTDLDLKALLLEAYLRGQETLLYVVPFVGKVLNSCIHSDVFKPPNPWTMALISVFIELHQEPDLKINLKFEVEILCKNLNLKIADLKPAFYLKNPDKVRQIEVYLLSPVKANKEAVAEAANAPIAHAKQVQMTPPQARMPIEEQAVETVTPTSGLIASDLNMMDIIGEPRLNCPDANLALNPPIVSKPYFNPSTLLLQNYPHLKQLVKPAIERSIQEWLHPVIERSLKYTLIACEHIVRKDFALHPDEMRMRSCAHHMAGGLISNVAMITCRQNVFNAISDNLKSAFLAAILPKTQQQRDLAVSAADVLAAENMEVACGFIQKAAVEKGLYELDKRLLSDYEIRKMARQEGKQYYDPAVLSYHMERMVERLRTCLGGPTDQRMAFVYDNQPCGASGPMQDMHAIMPKEVVQEQTPQVFYNELFGAHQVQATDAVAALVNEAEMFVSNAIGTASLAGLAANMHSLLECLSMSQRCKDNVAFGITLLQKAIEGLLELHTLPNEHVELFNRYRDIHLRLLKMLEDTRVFGHVWTTKQITHCLTECREEIRYNLEAVDCLIRSNLVNMPQYDVAIAKLVDVGNLRVVNFAMQLVQLYLVDDLNNMYVNETDLYHTTESLTRMLNHSRLLHPEGLGVLIETVRVNQNPSVYLGERSLYGPTAFIHSGIMIARAGNHDDPPGLREKTEILLREWCNYLHKQGLEIEIFHSFIVYLHRKNMQDILKNEDLLTRFLRIATQLCIENVYQLVNEDIANPQMPSKRERYYAMVDPFVKLVSYIIRNNANGGNPTPKLNLLNKFLGIIAGFLIQDQEDLKTQFHQLPYHRLMLILFLDMNVIADPVLEAMNYQVLTAFCHTLRIVRPSVAPGFCYAWLEVVAHRSFINRMLVVTPQQKGWGMYATLLIEQLKYLNPFLRNLKLAPPVVALYKGTMKLFLVLLHDFPEFLCDYHFAFCDEIPANCIQMRNLILSAFPRNMRLPDPMAPNLKVDLLVETSLPPRAVINNATILPPSQFKKDLDAYLEARAPVTFLSELRSNMQVQNTPGQQYNVKLINAVVLHVGIQAIAHIRAKGQIPSISTIAHSAHMDIFQNFTVDFDYEGRYLFLNSVANHLRYPNSHTHYFSCVILYLFAEAHSEAVQEQISRMLFERLIVNRPHPWGLLVTFIELIKNPTYKFWTHEFVKYAPEIEKKFSHLIDKARENNSSARN